MSEVEQLAKLGGTIVGTAVAVVVVLVPWLRQYVIKPLEALRQPVAETHHQVTVNKHASPEPTVLDELHTLKVAVGDLGARFGAMAVLYDNHLDTSARADREREQRDARLWAALDRLEARLPATSDVLPPRPPGALPSSGADYDPDPTT